MEFLNKIEQLKIKIFLDGADLVSIKSFASNNRIDGFTSNPSLMFQCGISNYEDFIIDTLKLIDKKPISFEVVSDDLDEIFEQAKRIASFGNNIYVKIPITNTKGQSCVDVIKELDHLKIPINVTAIMTSSQAIQVIEKIKEPKSSIILSIFAGRIADTGVDPKKTFTEVKKYLVNFENYLTLWASPREIYNLYEAEQNGVDIITITPGILKKAELFMRNLDEYSLETVKMFYEDAQKNKLTI